MPLYKGSVPHNFLELLANDPEVTVQERIEDFLKTEEIKPFYDPQSIVAKVVDNQRAAHYLEPFGTYKPSQRLMR
jgi:hypothetical protein